MDVADESSRRCHAQTPLIIGKAEKEVPEVILSEEEDRLLGCPEETGA